MGILLMAMTIGGVAVAGILLVVSLAMKKSWLAQFVFGSVAIWFSFYFVMLFGFSAASEPTVLALNEPKKFCGFYVDCHMHAAVKGVDMMRTIGNKTAAGEFYIVTVEIFSNAAKATLNLKTVDAHVVDAAGREYTRDLDAESRLPVQPAFEKLVGPEESFTKQIVFDLPTNVDDPRLDIREGGLEKMIEAFLINDEDSVLYGRSYFNLQQSAGTPAGK